MGDELKNFISRIYIMKLYSQFMPALKFFRHPAAPAGNVFAALIFCYFCIKAKVRRKELLVAKVVTNWEKPSPLK